MEKLYIIFLLVLIQSCSSPKPASSNTNMVEPDTRNLFFVNKIDSINSFYLIYAKKENTLYKIVSKKNDVANCKCIKVGGYYELKLNSIWNINIKIGDKEINPSEILHVSCLGMDDSTKICVERDSINDLHVSENLRGLCLINK